MWVLVTSPDDVGGRSDLNFSPTSRSTVEPLGDKGVSPCAANLGEDAPFDLVLLYSLSISPLRFVSRQDLARWHYLGDAPPWGPWASRPVAVVGRRRPLVIDQETNDYD
jgi:hypothetical protein